MNGQMNEYIAAQCPYKWRAGIILSPTPGFINGFIEEGTPAFIFLLCLIETSEMSWQQKRGKQSWTAKCVSVKMSHFPELFLWLQPKRLSS